MSFKDYKKGLVRVDCQAIENSRHIYARYKLPKVSFSWKNRGSWHALPPRRHPGWAAYHENKDGEGN